MAAVEVAPVSIPEQRQFESLAFPLVMSPSKPTSQLTPWVLNNWGELEKLALKHGAVLLRGFSVPDPAAFNEVVEAFGHEELPYIGGAAPRTLIVGRVFTANEAPAASVIPFHHEMAQVPSYPSHLFFYCDVPPAEGGQTPICLSHEVYQKMAAAWPQFVADLEEHGVQYTRVLPEYDDKESAQGRGWRSTFSTKTREETEAALARMGMTGEWLPNGDLKTVTGVLPAVQVDPRSGCKVWFNSVVAAFTGWKDVRNEEGKAVVLGNGKQLDKEAVQACLKIMNEVAVDFPWQKGDVLLIDNKVTMHGRRSFKPPRRILASLVK